MSRRTLVCCLCITITFAFALELLISSLMNVSDVCNNKGFCSVDSMKVQFLVYAIVAIIMAAISSTWGFDFRNHFRKAETRFFISTSLTALFMLIMIWLFQSGHNKINMPYWSTTDPEMQKEYIIWKLICGLIFVTELLNIIGCIFMFYMENDNERGFFRRENLETEIEDIPDFSEFGKESSIVYMSAE